MEFNIKEENWNFISDVGYPLNCECCLLICKDKQGNYYHDIGGYNEFNHTFYLNIGYGGMIIDANDVIAWVDLFKPNNKYLKSGK